MKQESKISLPRMVYLLKYRPKMICSGDSFESICCFLEGFSTAQVFMNSPDDFFGWGFQTWLYNKFDTIFNNRHWSNYIFYDLANEDSNNAKNKILDLLTEYVEDITGEKIGSPIDVVN